MKILLFSMAREEAGFAEMELATEPEETAREVIARAAPGVDVSGMRVAIDLEYRAWDAPVGTAEELAVIPPVSGG
jgi:molybdopterin converting factor small subunit